MRATFVTYRFVCCIIRFSCGPFFHTHRVDSCVLGEIVNDGDIMYTSVKCWSFSWDPTNYLDGLYLRVHCWNFAPLEMVGIIAFTINMHQTHFLSFLFIWEFTNDSWLHRSQLFHFGKHHGFYHVVIENKHSTFSSLVSTLSTTLYLCCLRWITLWLNWSFIPCSKTFLMDSSFS